MRFGDFYGNFRESGPKALCKIGGNGVFAIEMAGIDEIQSQILCVPEIVVFGVGGDEGVATGLHGFLHFAAAAAAAAGDLADGFSGICIAQSFAAQCGFYVGKEIGKVKVVINDGRPVISAICSAVQPEVFIISISNAAVI